MWYVNVNTSIKNLTNQYIILRNDSNSNHLWSEEDLILVGRYKRSSKGLGEILFDSKLINM